MPVADESKCLICFGQGRIHNAELAYEKVSHIKFKVSLKGLPCPICRPEDVEKAILSAEDEEIEHFLSRAGVPKKFGDVAVGDYVTSVDELKRFGLKSGDAAQRETWAGILRGYLENSLENQKKGVGLNLTGSVGTGKTMMLYIAAQHIIREHRRYVNIVPERTIFDSVKATFGNDSGESEQAVIKRFVTIHNLMIDDFGVRKATEWVTDIYHSIIDARWDAGLPTFISSNLPVSELAQIYPRQMDRLKKNVAIEMVGGSLRGTKLER